jgi:hypothetical protein
VQKSSAPISRRSFLFRETNLTATEVSHFGVTREETLRVSGPGSPSDPQLPGVSRSADWMHRSSLLRHSGALRDLREVLLILCQRPYCPTSEPQTGKSASGGIELGAMLLGRQPGRISNDQITTYKAVGGPINITADLEERS